MTEALLIGAGFFAGVIFGGGLIALACENRFGKLRLEMERELEELKAATQRAKTKQKPDIEPYGT